MPLTLKDSRSFETQIIDAVRSVNRALGGTYGTSSAIYKSDYNQYEVQLVDAIKGIGRTLSGKGLSISGIGGASEEALAALEQRVLALERESFFRLVSGNVTLKTAYNNLWVPGFLAAGGTGTAGGGGGGASALRELEDVYHSDTSVLRADGTTPAADGDALVYNSTRQEWVAAPVSGGSTVSVQSLSSSTANVSKIASVTINGTTTYLYNDVAWGSSGSTANTFTLTINGTTKTVCLDGYAGGGGSVTGYIGTTQVQTTSQSQAMTGISSVKLSSAASMFEWDSTNSAWHFYGNLYADGWVAAGGAGSGGGGGGSVVTVTQILSSGTKIATITVDGVGTDLYAPSGGGGAGTVTSVGLTMPTGFSVSGSPITSSGTLAVSLASGYVIPTQTTLNNFVTLDGTQTITGAKTFSTNPLSVASDSGISVDGSSYIDIGNARIVYDSGAKALHIKNKTGVNDTISLFADGFVSAGGTAAQSTISFVTVGETQSVTGTKTFVAPLTVDISGLVVEPGDPTPSALTIVGKTTATGDVSVTGNISATTFGGGVSISSDEINYGSRLYIQYNSNDLCLTKNGKTIIGTYPGSSSIGSNKLYVDGSAIATAWNTTSDRRLKDDISGIDGRYAVETLMDFKPSTWTWNCGMAKGTTAAGFIAQDVENIVPYMVSGEDYKSLNYQMLHAFEVSAIQDHETRLRRLEEKINATEL